MNPYKDLSREELLRAFVTFAKAVDPRIKTQCLHDSPDAPEGLFCGWDFTLDD